MTVNIASTSTLFQTLADYGTRAIRQLPDAQSVAQAALRPFNCEVHKSRKQISLNSL